MDEAASADEDCPSPDDGADGPEAGEEHAERVMLRAPRTANEEYREVIRWRGSIAPKGKV